MGMGGLRGGHQGFAAKTANTLSALCSLQTNLLRTQRGRDRNRPLFQKSKLRLGEAK